MLWSQNSSGTWQIDNCFSAPSQPWWLCKGESRTRSIASLQQWKDIEDHSFRLGSVSFLHQQNDIRGYSLDTSSSDASILRLPSVCIFLWCFRSLSSLCVHELAWSEICFYFLCCTVCLNNSPCKVRSSNIHLSNNLPCLSLSCLFLCVCVCVCVCLSLSLLSLSWCHGGASQCVSLGGELLESERGTKEISPSVHLCYFIGAGPSITDKETKSDSDSCRALMFYCAICSACIGHRNLHFFHCSCFTCFDSNSLGRGLVVSIYSSVIHVETPTIRRPACILRVREHLTRVKWFVSMCQQVYCFKLVETIFSSFVVWEAGFSFCWWEVWWVIIIIEWRFSGTGCIFKSIPFEERDEDSMSLRNSR